MLHPNRGDMVAVDQLFEMPPGRRRWIARMAIETLGGRTSLIYWEVGSFMRKFLTSGRRRYALALLVVGAGLAVMGAQCQPPKPPPPPQSGLSISRTVGDFGPVPVGTGEKIQFTVTNFAGRHRRARRARPSR
jgi:hypothetical protein